MNCVIDININNNHNHNHNNNILIKTSTTSLNRLEASKDSIGLVHLV